MPEPTEIPKLLNVNDLATRISVSRRTIYHWLTTGRCPIAPIPGMKPLKWRSVDVEAWLAGNQ